MKKVQWRQEMVRGGCKTDAIKIWRRMYHPIALVLFQHECKKIQCNIRTTLATL